MSALETTRWFEDLRFFDNDRWNDGQIIFSVLLITVTLVAIAYHFAEAWRTLPGAYYVSGNVNVNVVIKENLVSR